MKTTGWNTILVGIGAILVLALVGTPMIGAEEQTDSVLHELKQIEIQINELEENTDDFSIDKLGAKAFKFRIIGESLLDIQKSNNIGTVDGKQISKITDYLINNYQETHETYLEQVSNYQKHNAFSISEQLILNDLAKNEINFETIHDYQNKKELQQQLIKSELKRLQNESEFQNLINKIGIKLADEGNGNKVQKIQHKLALENIIINANWELAPAALDRIINQHSDIDSKTQMINNKEKILDLIEKLDEIQQQKPQLYTLTSGFAYIFFGDILKNENEIHTPHILASQIKNEIHSLAEQANSIVEEDQKRKYETLLAQRIDSQEEDHQDSIRKKILDSQPEPEPGNNGNGNGNGNGNENGNGNGNENGNGNGKGKGKKA